MTFYFFTLPNLKLHALSIAFVHKMCYTNKVALPGFV